MTALAELSALIDNTPVLVAVAEHVAPSMSGARAQRLAMVLDTLALDPSGMLLSEADATWLGDAISNVSQDGAADRWATQLDDLAGRGVGVLSCVNPRYPTNLQLVHDRPPLIFVAGELHPTDRRSIAVVGTRTASPDGVAIAHQLAEELSAANVTILSGLALGIDTAAHTACVNAHRRTIAVYGTPIDRTYPAANRPLAQAILRTGGAIISQFLPGTNTARWGFPVRNATMSGLAVGTIVVEAGNTSGAKIQAEAAIAHGKRLYLLDRLVTHQPWAQEMASLPNVCVAGTATEILDDIERLLSIDSIERV